MINYDKIYKQEWGTVDEGRFIGSRKRIILKLFPKKTYKNLDIGCGTGNFMDLLVNRGINIQGIDSSKGAIKIARKKGLQVKLGNCLNLKFKTRSLSVITAIDVLEHIKDDKKAINECYRVLKKDGYLIISVPFKKKLWRSDDEQVGHFRRYELKDIKRLFKNKFKIEKVRYSGFPFYLILRDMKILFNKKEKLTTGCLARQISKKNKLFSLIIRFIISFELIFQKIPFGTSIIIKARKL